MQLLALAGAFVTFVPMYATPTAAQLPVMIGRIAGARVVEPPLRMLGDYIAPGDAVGISRWLRLAPQKDAQHFVISTDMLAYGGLDASRVPGGVSEELAIARLGIFAHLRSAHPRAWIGAFGTVMRLEPTAVTAVGEAAHYTQIAQYPTWQYLWDYAQLHDPPRASEQAEATMLRSAIGANVLQQYLWTRKRDRDVDAAALDLTKRGKIDRFVLGADDAGPVGLHVRDLRVLRRDLQRLGIAGRAAIEPGADELGLVLVARALAQSVGWQPRIAIRYSRSGGGRIQDPLEYAPIDVTIRSLIRLAGGTVERARADLTLYVRVPGTDAAEDDALIRRLRTDVAARRSAALVDLTYLSGSYASEAKFVERLVSAGIAGKIDAYASWNTDANSVGIALGEAVAVGAGKRSGKYNPIAHAEFMLDRYIEDYLYHTSVRPQVNAELTAEGVTEHYWLAPSTAKRADARVRELLTPRALRLLQKLYPSYRAAHLEVRLLWPRTAELRSSITLVARATPPISRR